MPKHDPAQPLAASSQGEGRAGPCHVVTALQTNSEFLSMFPQGRIFRSHLDSRRWDDGHFAGLFSNPLRCAPCRAPCRSIMCPSLINRASCSAGITAGGPFTAVLPTVSREVNSCWLRRFDNLVTITRVWPFAEIRTWSNLIRSEFSSCEAALLKRPDVPDDAQCHRYNCDPYPVRWSGSHLVALLPYGNLTV